MDYFYAVQDEKQLANYQDFVRTYATKIEDYIAFLREVYQVEELPKAIIWSDVEMATRYIRESPVPAYTNAVRMVMTPDKRVWQELYDKQLEDYEPSQQLKKLRQHYQALTDRHVLQIVGHELAHWSELFLDDFEDSRETDIWFEEGMVEYISRRYFLTTEEFDAEKEVNQILVKLFQDKYGWHSLSAFGQKTYEGSYAAIFYEYWRSFLAIDQLVERLGSIQAVFKAYHAWAETDKTVSLLTWFELEEAYEGRKS